MEGLGWEVWGGRFGVEGLGWKVWGGRFGVEGLGWKVWVGRFGVRLSWEVWGGRDRRGRFGVESVIGGGEFCYGSRVFAYELYR